MGAVDLVVQVESPKSVARGLQRVGRAGHELGAVSKGRIFPKFRADLLESAVVARRMLDGEIEETQIPRNPLDVLAQQVVAIAADEEIQAGARKLAVTNGGTIPDRGLFGVHLVDGGGRVGELDEEMVYEARAGQTFLLGASTWRIEQITRDRVLVSPAPGVPGAVPFWRGEGVGRPFELGQKIGRASRELSALTDDAALERLQREFLLE